LGYDIGWEDHMGKECRRLLTPKEAAGYLGVSLAILDRIDKRESWYPTAQEITGVIAW